MIVNQKSLNNFRLLFDLIFLNFSFVLAADISQSFSLLVERNYMFILLGIQNIAWYLLAKSLRFYEDFYFRNFVNQFIYILKNVFSQIIISITFIFLFKEELFTRNFILLYASFLLLTISFRTWFFKRLLGYLRSKGKNVRNTIILGSGEVGKNFYRFVKTYPDFGYNIIGFVDDNSEVNSDKEILGSINNLEKIIIENKVEEVIITLSNPTEEELDRIITICNKSAVNTHIIPNYFKFLSKKFQISMIGSFPIINVRSIPLEEIQWRVLKRSFDLLFSILIILLTVIWLFPILIVLIKLSSKGPAFFIQERIGKNGKPFKCIKFRTMYIDTDSTKFVPTLMDDPRITKIGSLLRKSNLDELPQIFNVLVGSMSVVGPRPHTIAYNNQYEEYVDDIKQRNLVKPGITGWAQVHGLRGDIIDELENKVRIKKRIEYDKWYIENWSFWLDIQIILLTIIRMLKGDTKGH